MATKIYVLLDKNDIVRYVGKTNDKLERRLGHHVSFSKSNRRPSHRTYWIRECLSEGYVPTIRLLEEVEGDGCKEEIYWIKFFREAGLDLVNLTDGGDGSLGGKNHLGHHHSPETKAKLSKAQTGKKASLEARAKISLALKGRKVSETAKANMRKAQKGNHNWQGRSRK